MEIKYFPKIAIGSVIAIDGETYRKVSDLIVTDPLGTERYIDPLFDQQLGKRGTLLDGTPISSLLTAASTAPTPTPVSHDTIENEKAVQDFLSDADVDRIARRVAEILKGQ